MLVDVYFFVERIFFGWKIEAFLWRKDVWWRTWKFGMGSPIPIYMDGMGQYMARQLTVEVDFSFAYPIIYEGFCTPNGERWIPEPSPIFAVTNRPSSGPSTVFNINKPYIYC